ncbi:MAG: ribonuclease D [Gemmataceae bacterium]
MVPPVQSWNQRPEELVTTPQQLERCCEHLSSSRRFGFDTEFVGEDSYHPKLCLIQVATDSKLFLIDPQAVGALDTFWNLVTDPNHLIIVHAAREEIRLCNLWAGAAPGNLFDLQIAAGLLGYSYPLSHTNLVNQVLGIKLPKAETLTEWRNRPLSPEQVRYAYDDVRYLLPMWERLSTELDKRSRLSWANEEFERLKGVAALDENNVLVSLEKWRKLRGLGNLDRRRLAIVRELYDWREGEAARTNRPARTVVRDDLIVEIAKRNPKRTSDLQIIRGLSKRLFDPILEAVDRARRLPSEACPKPVDKEQDPPQLAIVAHILNAFLNDYCAKHHLANNLVTSNHDIKQILRCVARNHSFPTDLLLTVGWRSQHILPELLAVLNGKRSIRIGDIQCSGPLRISE